jgi:hypothetical protein
MLNAIIKMKFERRESFSIHTNTHIHTHRERERESARERKASFLVTGK